MSDYLFISDLHLSTERPEIINLFLKFMDEIAPSTKKLYILGDFLEYWIGDDMDGQVQGTPIADVFLSLQLLQDKGTDVFFMHGNRDFLVGQDLADKYQFKIIDDPATIEINNTRVLLMHGDTLCTDDLEYQNYRTMVRDENWKNAFISKPIEVREQIAKELRKKSKDAIAEKDAEIMDVNNEAVTTAMMQHDVETLIHGHTHRPAIHNFEHQGKQLKRIVLADWYYSGSYLEITDGDFDICEFH